MSDAGGEASEGYSDELGGRLREVRRAKGLSLQQVEQLSGEEFKASVVGAYERGDRVISVPRLQRLAKIYGVAVDRLLPNEEVDRAVAARDDATIAIDLVRLEVAEGEDAELLRRYVRSIRAQRQSANGTVMVVRREDVRAIATFMGVSEDDAVVRLDELGVRPGP